MKKNIAMRLASGVMLSCLLTSCVISGTFAKYTTADSANDSARVAKWGVTIDVSNVQDTFAKKYDNAANLSGTKVVSTTDVIAPGTNGALGDVTIAGSPEVQVTVSYTITVDLTGTWADKDSHYYCPLTIDDKNGMDYNTVEEFEAALSKTVNTVVEVGQSLDISYGYTWAWAFETGADADEKAANNIKDTYLGNLAADGDASNDPTITFSISVTVEQND